MHLVNVNAAQIRPFDGPSRRNCEGARAALLLPTWTLGVRLQVERTRFGMTWDAMPSKLARVEDGKIFGEVIHYTHDANQSI
jgi:hypothetical protein